MTFLRLILIVVYIFYSASALDVKDDKLYVTKPDLFYMDDYDKCMLLNDESWYCSLIYKIEPIANENVSEIFQFIQKLNSNPKNFKHDLLRHRICLAFTCPNALNNSADRKEEIKKCYDEKYKSMGIKGEITQLTCWNKYTDRYPISVYDKIVWCFIIAYVLLVIFCTLYEGVYRYESKEVYNQLMSTRFGQIVGAFSVTKNWYRLTTVELTPETAPLRYVQGVRFYSMLLVILCHVAMVYTAVPTSNPQFNENVYSNILTQIMSNGSFLCATFFVLTTFLTSYNIYGVIEKKAMKWKHFLIIFVNRYIRLTPAFAAVIAFQSTLMARLGDGPFWDDLVGPESRNCRKNWLAMLFYVHNYVDRYNMCMQHTWYIALDMQFFILTLTLMYLIQKYNRPYLIPILSMLVTASIYFTLNYVNGYDAVPLVPPDMMYFFEYFKYPYWHDMTVSFFAHGTNIGMGLLYGYYYYRYRHLKLFTSKFKLLSYWPITYGLGLGIILLPNYLVFQVNLPKNIFWASLYVATSKIFFILGVMFGLHGVTQGVGWAMRFTLEYPPTYILGRLTYSTYLVHVFVVKMQFGFARHLIYINEFYIVIDTLANVCMCLILGLVLTLLFELPISALQKTFLPQKNRLIEAEKSNKVNGVNVNGKKVH